MTIIFKKSVKGRRGVSLPVNDVPVSVEIPEGHRRKKEAALCELSELDVVRHFTELSRKNFGVDTNFYPLSNNIVSLKNEVDSWNAGGGTCICCGINKAVYGLSVNSTSDKFRSIVIMSDGQPTYYCNSFNDFYLFPVPFSNSCF